MTVYFWVASGGAIGSVVRFWLSGTVDSRVGPGFPWGTLLVNLIGCFLIGALGRSTGPEGSFAGSHGVRHFAMVGILGGFTTFSAFSLQTLDLLRAGEVLRAAGYVFFSVAGCLAGVWAGHSVGR